VAFLTMDHHRVSAFRRARTRLENDLPGLALRFHVAADWAGDPRALEACRKTLASADLVVAAQLFMEQHYEPVLPQLRENRDRYDALVCLLSAGPVTRLTRMGKFSMGGAPDGGEGKGGGGRFSPRRLFRLLKGARGSGRSSGRRQMAVLRALPRLLRFVPGTAQDVRAYLLALQYWLSGSEENLVQLVRFVVGRYGATERLGGGRVEVEADPPRRYPDEGLYHPDAGGLGIVEDPGELPRRDGAGPQVGLLLMRSYVLSGNTAHYDAVIRALEERGIAPLPAFAAGLDAREVVERYFDEEHGGVPIDALLSLTGFSLVGGPAYSDATAAQRILERLGVPYLNLQPLEFQTVEGWQEDPRGLTPLQSALMISIPELEGATGPLVFGGYSAGKDGGREAVPIPDRVERIADRIDALVELRRTPREERKVAVVLFNFPPNGGAVGTAAYLDVFASLHRTLEELARAGYRVEVPEDAEELRRRILEGNGERYGTPANVHARVKGDDHVRRERHLEEIEATWGPAPGRELSDGRSIFVLGERFGEVFVGVQPPFGWEGDPMRLLFEGSFAPTHAFSAFYRWIREDFGAHACLHFGTHGALEFMPGKQVGLGAGCWPDRLIADLPHFYLYAANNPSEGTLAKRRAAATLVSYRTPPVVRAGLYRGFLELRRSLDAYRTLDSGSEEERARLLEAIGAQARAVDLLEEEAPDPTDKEVEGLRSRLLELEHALVPHGLHVVGRPPGREERRELLEAAAEAGRPGRELPPLADVLGLEPDAELPEGVRRALGLATELLVAEEEAGADEATQILATGGIPASHGDALARHLVELDRLLREDGEPEALVRALDGRYVPPVPGGDVIRNPEILPTGRNLYGFDPYGIPTARALAEGRAQARRLLERHRDGGHGFPETVAFVLWGTDNMKREGAPLAQVLALLGAEPRFDGYGRLTGARLLSLEELGRPRVDVVVTTSGIFRDLLPLQIRLLAEAARLAATADEPGDRNFVRRHALAQAQALDRPLEEAALRVFSNADGAYGAQVNQTVEGGTWAREEELGRVWLRRKGFAYGPDGRPVNAPELLSLALSGADLAYQNLDSVELGVSDVDQYVDSLGGMVRAAREAGGEVPTYIGDETRGRGRVRSLSEQIELETRTRVLNPRWYEPMLDHGYQGVRELESRITTALGWSATADAVPEWAWAGMGETFVLDPEMRRRLSEMNPTSAARMAGRLVEACDRGYWVPDPETEEALREASDELDDRLEGIDPEVAA